MSLAVEAGDEDLRGVGDEAREKKAASAARDGFARSERSATHVLVAGQVVVDYSDIGGPSTLECVP
jgi:hypothetical protein